MGGCRSAFFFFFFFFPPRDLLPPERSQRQLPLRPARVILLPNVQVLRHCEVCFHDVVFIFVPFAFFAPSARTDDEDWRQKVYLSRPAVGVHDSDTKCCACFFFLRVFCQEWLGEVRRSSLSFGDKVAATDIVTISPPYLCIINPFLFCPTAKLAFFAHVSMPNDCACNERVFFFFFFSPLVEHFFFSFTVYHGCVRVVALAARLRMCVCVPECLPLCVLFVLPFEAWLCVFVL